MKHGKPQNRFRWRCVVAASVLFAGLVAAAPIGPATAVAAAGTAPRFISPANFQYHAGGANALVVAASGSPTPRLTMSGTLPSGLSFRPKNFGAAVITGDQRPAITGQRFTVTVTASNGVSPNAVQQLTLVAPTTTTTTSLSVSPNPSATGQRLTYTARVTPVPNGGTIDMKFGTVGQGATTGPITGCTGLPVNTSTGMVTCTSASLLAGTPQVYATFSGFGLFATSSSPGTPRLTVNPRPPAYWLATTNGRVFGRGTAPSLGNANTRAVTAMAPTAGGRGYYVVGAGGGVFTFGNARFFGSVPGLRKRISNIVAIAVTPGDRGYYLLGADGGVFTFGDARFNGSLPGIGIRTQHVVGMVTYPASTGYLIVSRDGGVFTFGHARFYGSVPGMGIRTTTIRAIQSSADGTGYVLVSSNGTVYNFGGARSFGSLPSRGIRVNDIVGIALTQDQDGYYMAGADGRVFAFGSAQLAPAPSGLQSNLPVAAIAAIPPPPPTVGLAQRFFNGIVHFLPNDRFGRLLILGQDEVGFQCSTCGPQYMGAPFHGFTISVYKNHWAALNAAVQLIFVAIQLGAASLVPAGPYFVAGNAVLSQAPARVATAFGRAVGQPVATVNSL